MNNKIIDNMFKYTLTKSKVLNAIFEEFDANCGFEFDETNLTEHMNFTKLLDELVDEKPELTKMFKDIDIAYHDSFNQSIKAYFIEGLKQGIALMLEYED